MKHLQLFEDFSAMPESGTNPQEIAKMFQEATKNFSFGVFSNWDEEKIKDAFLMIKTKQEFDAVNRAINEAYEKVELSGGDKVKYPTTVGLSRIPASGKTGYVVNDPEFDWLFEIYYACFGTDLGSNWGKDESYRKEIINHLSKSKIINLNAPLRKEMSPFAAPAQEVHNGDWRFLGL